MKVLPFCLLVCLLPLQATTSEFVNTTCTPELENTRERYEKFKRQHVDKNMTAQNCTAAMKQKKIYDDDNNVCKKINTFILADAKEVQSVCKGQGIYNNKSHYTESKKKFEIVICTVKKQARKPKCEYKGKNLKNRVIAVSCKDGLPVHFAGDHK